VAEQTSFHSTYGWHPLSVEATIANVRWMIRHEKRLLAQVNETGDYFRARLSAMRFRTEVEIRVAGLAIGIATGDEAYASRIGARASRKRLLISASGDLVTMFPPLTIDRKTVEEGLDRFETCLR
jgi:putrescine aminotransferase